MTRGLLSRTRKFFDETLWELEAGELGRLRRAGVVAVRTAAVVIRDIAEGQLTLRAMSLVYTTLLSLVPLLAVSFSVLKAFGAHNQIEPFLLNLLMPLGEKGAEITGRIIEFVENTRVGVLGAFGMAFLFYTVVALIQKIERAFNDIWLVKNERPLARRFSDYLSVVLIGPVLVFSAIGVTATLTSNVVVDYVAGIEPFGTLISLIGRLVPYFLIIVAFTFIYIFVPNTRVRIKCAAIGAVVAGVLWATLGWGFAAFIASSGKYTAIYSAFATLIFFMIWLYLGWLILLVGASVAFYNQHPEFVGRDRGEFRLSNLAREQLAMAIMYLVGRAFHDGEAPPDATAMASRLGVPPEVVEQSLDVMRQAGLVRLAARKPPGWVPSRPLEKIGTIEVIEAVRSAGGDRRLDRSGLESRPPVPMVFERLDESRRAALGGVTVRDWIEE